MFKKLWRKVFGREPKGTPCWMLAKEGSRVSMCPGIMLINHKDAILISYEFVDNTGHSLITHQDDYLCLNASDGRPVYVHNVGDLFTANCRFQGQVGSEYFHSILQASLGTQMLRTLEDYQEGGRFPWKTVILIAGIIIGVMFLKQAGILDSLLSTITGSVHPGPAVPAVPTPGVPVG